MTTEIIIAIIGSFAVIASAIIGLIATNGKREKNSEEFHLRQQNANIQGDNNSVKQAISGSDFSQSATIKGNNNFIKQNKK